MPPMSDDERNRIAQKAREEADLANRIRNLEADFANIRSNLAWIAKAIYGGVAYLAVQLWTFIANGGSIK